MLKVFLSHSSKQKGFVEIVATKLGKGNVVFDQWTFENANLTIDEIYSGLDSTGIFVYFISNESLNSDWVKEEINLAHDYLNNGKIKRFLPLLIDHNIKHSDNRIPSWIKEQYNIKYISRPTKCYELIRQSLRLVTWELFPKKRLAENLFFGRTEQIKLFEERIYDIERTTPVGVIVSGLNAIGRRKFSKHVLKNANKITSVYEPPSIALDRRNSIEDFILKIYGLGSIGIPYTELQNFMSKTLNEKIIFAARLVKELNKNNDLIFILDDFAIVSKNGQVADWFSRLVKELNYLNSLTFCVISQSRVHFSFFNRHASIFSIEIPELEEYERTAFFKSLLDLEKIQLSLQTFKILNALFTGFPEQIIFTVNLIKHEGIDYVLNHTYLIVEFNTAKVARIVKNFEHDILALQILKILSETEFLSINMLEVILKDDFAKSGEIISQFSNEFIIEYIGNSKEFMRLNESVKDYIQRLGYKMDDKYRVNLQTHAMSKFKEHDIIDQDISDFILSAKESLKVDLMIDDALLIPSQYVNAMRELYNYDRRYSDVINLSKRILNKEENLDERITLEVRYWMCLSYARLRDRKVLEEVQKIEGPEHDFIKGFYYRIVGRNEDAIKCFESVLDQSANFYRAKRELVQVLLNMEDYSNALSLARDNYNQDKNNPYNAQSYFRCLIKTDGKNASTELKQILDDLDQSRHVKAHEMYLTSKSLFESLIMHDEYRALRTVDDAINTFPKNIYPYLTKLELLRKSNNIKELSITVDEIDSTFHHDSDIYNKLPYLSAKCILFASSGNKNKAFEVLHREIQPNFSHTSYENLHDEISSNP